MRSAEFRTRRAYSATIVLLLANLVVFILQEVHKAYGVFPYFFYLVLSKEGLSHGYVWQLLTFQFLHIDRWHFLFNMLGLYLFGRAVEEAIGRRHFWGLYFASGTIGGILQVLLGLVLPVRFGVPVVGASAGVFGLIAAFAVLDPDREILLFFILPMRAKHFLWLAGAAALFYVLVPADRGIAHGAHLGGILGGWAYINGIVRSEVLLRMWRPSRTQWRREELVQASRPRRSAWPKPRRAEQASEPRGDFISREVDPILDKISAHGIQSLTPHERKILELAREKMERR